MHPIFSVFLLLLSCHSYNQKFPEDAADKIELSELSSDDTQNDQVLMQSKSFFTAENQGPLDALVTKMLFPGREKKQSFDKCESQQVYNYKKVDAYLNETRMRYYERDNGTDSVILFFHGNGSTACDSIDLANYLTGVFNKSIVIAEYPGYSGDNQISSERTLTASALAIFEKIQERYTSVDVFGFHHRERCR